MKRNIFLIKRNILLKTVEIANNENFEIFIVGGKVRDLFLEIKNFEIIEKKNAVFVLEKMLKNDNFDFDFTVKNCEINAKDIFYLAQRLKINLEKQNDFNKNFEIKIKKNEKFYTVNMCIFSRDTAALFFCFDIATIRDEKYDFSGALPTVFSTDNFIKDIQRRDITINSIAVKLNLNANSKIIDFLDGISDLKNRKIRLNYEKSLIDDPTRIFRLIRFAMRFDFEFEEKTKKLLEISIKEKFYEKISKNRILNEIKKCFNEQNSIKIFVFMKKFSLLSLIDENLENIKNFREFEKYLKILENFIFYLQIYDLKFEKWFLYFLILAKNLHFSNRHKISEKFGFEKEKKKDLLENLDKFKNFFCLKKENKMVFKDSEIYFALQNISINFIVFLLIVCNNENLQSKILKYLLIVKYTKLEINGDFLKKFGVKDGEIIGDILRKSLIQKIDFGFKNKKAEELFAKKLILKNIQHKSFL